MRIIRMASTVLLLALAACGSVKNNPDGGGGDSGVADFTIVANPTSLVVPIAGSQDVTVTVERSGAVGDIMLSSPNLPGNLTVAFSPNPIPAGTTTATATVSAAGGSAPGTGSVTLTGTAGSIEHSAMVSVTTSTIMVSGVVRGNRSGVRVGIIGKQSVLSGAGGVFSFTDVTPPYDLYTLADGGLTSNPTPTVYFWDNLTIGNPIVTAATTTTLTLIGCGIGTPCPQATVNGTRTGTGNNTDPAVFVWSNGGSSTVLSNAGVYQVIAGGFTSGTSQGSLYGLQFTRKASGAPDVFQGFKKSAVFTLTNGGTSTIDLMFAPVSSTASISGTLTGPANYPSPTISLYQEFGATQASLWTTTTTTSIDANFPLIPTAGGASLYATSTLNGGISQFVQPLNATATVSFAMPAAAVASAPADAATGVTTSTMFAWASAPMVINEINVATSTPTRASFRIFTTASQTTIPVIPELALPPNQAFSWRVYGYGPNTSINQAASANELESVSSADYSGPAHAYTFSASRTFTSAP